jgi:hypothetical protein
MTARSCVPPGVVEVGCGRPGEPAVCSGPVAGTSACLAATYAPNNSANHLRRASTISNRKAAAKHPRRPTCHSSCQGAVRWRGPEGPQNS